MTKIYETIPDGAFFECRFHEHLSPTAQMCHADNGEHYIRCYVCHRKSRSFKTESQVINDWVSLKNDGEYYKALRGFAEAFADIGKDSK